MPSQPEDIIDDHGIAYSSWHQLLLGGNGISIASEWTQFSCSIQSPEKRGTAPEHGWPRYPTKQPFMAVGPVGGGFSTQLPEVRSGRMFDEERR